MPENNTPEVAYLRKRDDSFVYHSTETLLARGDLFPCDKDGRFMTTGTQELLPPVVTSDEPTASTTDDSDNADDNDVVIAMLTRAKELGIKNAHAMREDTLAARIAEAEAELTKTNGNQSEGNQD